MARDPDQVMIYHITDVANLPGILTDDGLYSDALMVKKNPEIIGYDHIKKRRLKEIPVPCCGRKYVGEFVPFYFCPRSPMLFTINKGNTGRAAGCQKSIVHLVSTMAVAIGLNKPWAISDGNAGAFHTTFSKQMSALEDLDWVAIGSTHWAGMQHQKSAEFLIADLFPWTGLREIGCYNSAIAAKVSEILASAKHKPIVNVKPGWYY